jgi:acyl-CoA reductase-like NAD-dependent aldehyde dehydrogenase
MIDTAAAERAERLITATVQAGARRLVGGTRRGRFVEPAVLVDVKPEMGIACDEAFAPVVAVLPYTTIDQAVRLANGTRYGLQAAVFTESIDVALTLARRLEVGGVIVNEGSSFRIDQMPFGGVKDSGVGREGVKYAIAELTEPRLVAFSPKPSTR